MQPKRKLTLTGYRVLFILKLLLIKPMSKKEILSELEADSYVGKISADSLRLDIKTLRDAGFIISHPKKAAGYKYEIDWSPIKLKLTQKELSLLNALKSSAIQLTSWQYIIKLYTVMEKIAKYTDEDEALFKLLNFEYFVNIDFKFLKELNTLIENKSEVVLLYNSPNSGLKEIKINLCYLKYNGSKLHVYGKSSKYPNLLSLRLDNIEKIIKIIKMKTTPERKVNKTVIYKISAKEKEFFAPEQNEVIISCDNEYIKVRAYIENEFIFIQRLLSFGENFIEVDNKTIKNKLVKYLKSARKLYD